MSESTTEPIPGGFDPRQPLRANGTSFLRVIGLSWVVAAGWFFAGQLGLIIGLGIFAFGLFARPFITIVVAHAALIAVLTDVLNVTGLIQLGTIEVGLLAVLASERPFNPIVVILTIGGVFALTAGFIAVVMEARLITAIAALIGVVGFISYILHRYGRATVLRAVTERREDESISSSDGGE